MTCSFMRIATLQFEKHLQKCIRIGITIFKIFIWGGISSVYGRKSRFTATHEPRCKTKFPTIYLTIYLPIENFEYSYPLIDREQRYLSATHRQKRLIVVFVVQGNSNKYLKVIFFFFLIEKNLLYWLQVWDTSMSTQSIFSWKNK